MAARNNSQIRRDINRLDATIKRHPEITSLAAIAKDVSDIASKVNNAYRNYQLLTVQGKSERTSRDSIIVDISKWIQEWRPVVLIKVPGAQDSIRALPNSGITPDEIVNVAKDLVEFIKVHPEAKGFSEEVLKKEAQIEEADKKVTNASSLLAQEKDALKDFSGACDEANNILVKGSDIVRAVFGKTSPEYKKLIAKSSSSTQDDNPTDNTNDNDVSDESKVDNPAVK